MKTSAGRLCLSAILAAAFSVSLQAQNVWFDAGIANYEKWPTEDCPGVWQGTDYAELDGEAGAHVLKVSTPAADALSFTADGEQELGGDVVSVRTRAKISIIDAGEAFLEPVAGAKTAITAAYVEGSDVPFYFGLAKDPASTTNTLVKLIGATPDRNAVVEVGFDVKKSDGATLVRYLIDGTILTDESGAEWLESATSGAAADNVSSVLYLGSAEVSSLAGATEKDVAYVAVTIPAVPHMTVASVSVGGIPVEADDGVYMVPQGSVVSVRFDPDAGYALSTSRVKVKVGDEPMEFPQEEYPAVIRVGDSIRINEIVASNGSSLTTKSGVAGIDWVELYNAGDNDIDLTGWYLGNDPTKKASKWGDFAIQGNCVVPAKGYKIIWCDGDSLCNDFASDEAYVRCNISTTAGKHTVFLASNSEDPDDRIIQQIKMPAMIKDVSYGLGHRERTLLSLNDATSYKVGDGEWREVRGPVGMSATPENFTVTTYKSKVALNNLDIADSVMADETKWAAEPVTVGDIPTIAFRNTSEVGDFDAAQYSAFPSGTGDIVLVARGAITIPHDGLWTFAVSSDDGFRLTLKNPANTYTMECSDTRSYAATDSCFNMDAGAYELELVYFDRSGNAAVDVSVAEGDFTVDDKTFNTDDFALVGGAGCEVAHAGAIAGQIAANVEEEMKGVEDTLYWKGGFFIDEVPEDTDTFTLKLRASDVLTASVNGTAVQVEPAEEAGYFNAVIANDILQLGNNQVEITIVNNDVDDGDLFLAAQVVATSANGEFCYFRETTPNKPNTAHGYGPMTPSVTFSAEHGYKTEAFELALSCETAPYSPIYYTLDGTSPTTASALYTGPITISGTTCIRTAVPQENTILQVDSAATYIFVEDVLATPQGVVPPNFPASGVNGQAMRYGMNQTYVAKERERLLNGFTNSIATMSIVVDPKNLFDKAKGIYVNPSGDGRGWERAIMLEQINPTGDAGFSVPAGIRIRGAASRNTTYAKHSLRFFFRSDYGMGSLDYKLFGDEGADSFDKVDLRCSQNYSMANRNSTDDTFIHECFSRDSQRDMGEHYTRSRYYNLFINGVYWGLYQTQERGDTDFAETYNGGAADNYDVIKTSINANNQRSIGVNDGTKDAWEALRKTSVDQGYAGEYESNYYKMMGLNPDGTRNPDYPVYLNPTNLAVFIISAQYSCDGDSPFAVWGPNPNNLYALRNRVDVGDPRRDGFFFLRHDAEHSLGVKHTGEQYAAKYGQYNNDSTGYGVSSENINGSVAKHFSPNFDKFGPQELHFRLCKNPEYRQMFADLFYKHCLKEGGAMTAPVATERFRSRMAEIDDAIAGEVARWSTDVSKRNRETWLNACTNTCIAGFIEKRMPYMKSHYQARGWYPVDLEPPVAVDANGAPVADGAKIAADAKVGLSSSGATILYTLDGTDPRLVGGEANPNALAYEEGFLIPPEGVRIAMRARSASGEWSAIDFIDLKGEVAESSPADALRVASVMSSAPGGDADDFIVLTNVTDGVVSLGGVKLVAWNAKKKTEDSPSLTLVFSGDKVLKAGESLTLTVADFAVGDKLADSDVGMRLYDTNGETPVLIQDIFVSGGWFGGICDGEGAFFVAREFGQELKTADQWKPSESWTERGLRFFQIEGLPATGNDGAGEYFVLTNILDKADVDLAGVKVVIGKAADIAADGDSAAKCIVNLASGTIPAGAAVKLDQPTYGWKKITDGDLTMKIYDAEGALVQLAAVKQKSFTSYAAGDAVLQATSFLRETGETDWMEVALAKVVEPGAPATVAAANADEAVAKVVFSATAPDNGTGTPVVADDVYKGYFILKATPVEGKDGEFVVEAVLNEELVRPVIGGSQEISFPFVVGESGCDIVVKALPGLYYSLLRGEGVEKIETVRDCKLATGDTVELSDGDELPKSAFYRVLTTIDERKVAE